MKLILNIGMHKTGSSAIQNSLKGFADENSIYLRVGHPNHSSLFMTMYMSKPETYVAHRKNNRTTDEVYRKREEFSKLFRKFCKENALRDVIASAEDIGLMSEEDLFAMKSDLDQIFDDYLIIGYARPPNSLMASALQQRVAGGMLSLSAKSLYPNYRARIEKFDNVFGCERVLVGKFDRKSLFKGDVVLDFANKTGIDFPEADTLSDNVSRSLEATAVVYTEGKLSAQPRNYPGSPVDNSRLIKLLKTLGDSKVKLHRDYADEVIRKNREDLDWISHRVGEPMLDEPYAGKDALTSLEALTEIGSRFLPEITEILADTAKQSPVEDPQLVADAMSLLRRLIRRQRESSEPK